MSILDKDDGSVESIRDVKDTPEYKEKAKKERKKEKLTNWENEPDVMDLKEDYTRASGPHSGHTMKVRRWLDNLNIEGSAKLQKVKNRSSVQPQVIRKQAEWRYAALSEPFLATPDLFDISPVSWEDRRAANQNALIINNQFQTKIDKVKFIDEYIRSAVDEGTAIVRLGWLFEEGEVEVEKHTFEYMELPEEQQEEFAQYLQQMAQMQVEAPDSYETIAAEIKESIRIMEEEERLVACEIKSTRTVKETKTIINHPELIVCDYNDVIIDPTCNGDLDKANYVIYKFESSFADLKKSGKYENLDEIEYGQSGVLDSDDDYIGSASLDSISSVNFEDKSRQKLKLYEYWGYWDIHDNQELVPIVATWCNNTLLRMEENPFPDGKVPFVAVPYLPVKNSIYGEPDGALLEDHQNIIGALTRGMIDLLGKSANGQTAMPKSMLDSVNKTKFLSGQDYEYNPISGINPQTHIFQHKYPEIPQSAMQIIQWLNTEAEALTGTKAFSTGGGITGANLGDTAAGVRGALDAASKREMGILRRLSNGIIKIGRKIIAMNAEFLEEEEIVRVTNEEFVKIRKDDLAGNFDLKLTISTAEADNAKAQELSFMLQTMGNSMAPEMTNMILSEIARLRQMPDLAKKIIEFKPEPDPMQQQMQELEMQKLQAEIALLQAEAAEAGAKSQVQQTKVGVEQARAQSLAADAQTKGVKLENDMTGENHRRQLEVEQQRGLNELDVAEQVKELELRNKLAEKSAEALTKSYGMP